MEPNQLIPPLPSSSVVPGPSRFQLNQQVIFDFTKRKRWADLLVTELTEAIMLVLSASGQVWFCSPAVEELLGWKDEEIVDGDLIEVMNEEDRASFQRQYAESIRTRTDLLSYVRLQCKTDNDLYPNIPVPLQSTPGSGPTEFAQIPTRRAAPKEVLFEIKGYAHYVESSDPELPIDNGIFGAVNDTANTNPVDVGTGEVFKCFFAMARPYPSRNTAMLHTFLELKIENERLQQRLKAARSRLDTQSQQSQQSESRQPHPFRTPSYTYPYPDQSPQSGYNPGTAYPHEDRSNTAGSSSKARVAAPQEDVEEHIGPVRKKSKRSLGTEQHVCVTCGRTDSPEWRKGPLGPKTLCNACGLRWAKTVRRDPAPTSAAEAGTDNQGESTSMGSELPTMNSGSFNY